MGFSNPRSGPGARPRTCRVTAASADAIPSCPPSRSGAPRQATAQFVRHAVPRAEPLTACPCYGSLPCSGDQTPFIEKHAWCDMGALTRNVLAAAVPGRSCTRAGSGRHSPHGGNARNHGKIRISVTVIVGCLSLHSDTLSHPVTGERGIGVCEWCGSGMHAGHSRYP